MEFDLVIKNGTLINPDTAYRADVGVRGERIAAIGEALAGRQEIDATGMLVTPGAVDLLPHRLDVGGAAYIAGGEVVDPLGDRQTDVFAVLGRNGEGQIGVR